MEETDEVRTTRFTPAPYFLADFRILIAPRMAGLMISEGSSQDQTTGEAM
jgi:hypothetical protein